VQGPRGGADCSVPPAFLALRPLAAVPLGELAAADAAQLPALPRALLLVAQPENGRL
jgi:hypothetical protein